MEGIKIWAIDASQVEELKPTSQTESERLLEDTLVSRPDLLLEDLTLVGRQTPTDGGPLDLLGVDGEGRLVVFELKRGTLSRDAVAQVIDYASYLDDMNSDELSEHISQNSGKHGINKIDDFTDWYSQQGFEGSESLESLKPLRMVLVGLGVDDRTERMTRFLAENSDMDISLLTFHGFTMDGRTILAKQVEVDGSNDGGTQSGRRRLTRAERWDLLNNRARESRVHELFGEVRDIFKKSWPDSNERPTKLGVNVTLPSRAQSGRRVRRRYARVDPLAGSGGRVRIVFYPRAANLCRDEFIPIIDEIGGGTYPKGRDPLRDTSTEILLPITAGEWEAHKEKLTALVRTVYEAWENQGADGESDSA